MNGWIFSIALHAGLALILVGVNFTGLSKKVGGHEDPPCTIPLEVTTISEVSQAPISKPKGNPQELSKESSKEIIQDVLPTERESEFVKEIPPEPIKEALKEPESIKEVEKIPESIKETPEEPKKMPETLKEKVSEPVEETPKEPGKVPVADSVRASKPEKTQADKVLKTALSPKKDSSLKKKKLKNPQDLLDKVFDKVLTSSSKQNSLKKPAQENFMKVLKDIEENDGGSAQTPITDPNSTSHYGAARVGPLAMSVIDRVKRMLYGAWRVPLKAHEGGDLVVVVQMIMNPDGTVNRAEVLDRQGTPGHVAYRVGVESALRAVEHFRHIPLPFSPLPYDEWKVFQCRFIPQ